jgi:23S rRNA (cytosine1962-C5)-methyltransferase
VFEDEDLLVVNKPAGLNTHAPSPFAGEGLFEWLREREPRWADLAILHRLDKETSGLIVFGKTRLANRSLTDQFTQRRVRKEYVLLTDRPPKPTEHVAISRIERAGPKYVSRPVLKVDDQAETRFQVLDQADGRTAIVATPVTGRTHQIRVHASDLGFPILGDTLYGGSPWTRLCLHARQLSFQHPHSGEVRTFIVEPDFAARPQWELRRLLIDCAETNATRMLHGAADGEPGWYVDRVGEHLLSQSAGELSAVQLTKLKELASGAGIYHKILRQDMQPPGSESVGPRLVHGPAAEDRFIIRENNVRFELSFREGYSIGLFLDQRDNRRRLLRGQIARDFPPLTPSSHRLEVLNAFAYTCGFSVCAALAGAATTSLDLSRKYLEWGQRNFRLNELDPAGHAFIYGDAFDWFSRLARKRRQFDVVLLDPPTFSRSKSHGVFRVEKDLAKLVQAALPLVRQDGVLLVSTNLASMPPEQFLSIVQGAMAGKQRTITAQHYFPQPTDFPVDREEPAYLKTVWLRLAH